MDSVSVRHSAPFVVFVMGVSGSGKTTVAKALCAHLKCAFLEGDDFHPSSNREKMQSGTPLTDEDRLPWLRALNEAVKEKLQKKTESVVVACSALKETYRSVLTDGLRETDYAFVCLVGPKEVLAERMRGRDHFMPVSLLESQLQTLQVPDAAAPRVIIVDIQNSVEKIVEIVCRWLSTLFQKDGNNSAGDYAIVMAAVLTGNPDALRHVPKDSFGLTDESGWSPLHAAADVGYANVARTLISLGAPLSAKATLLHNWTPLHVAAFKGNAEIVKVICEEATKRSFSVDEKDDIGCTPLRLACHSGFIDCVALLITNGADVNSTANDGSTSLHVAASADKLEVCRTLLDNGAAVEPVDKSGTYPLQLAKKAAHIDVCKLLIDRGARVGCC